MTNEVKKLGGTVEKKSKLYLISNIISFLYFVVTVVTIIIISKVNVLPTKYMVLLSLILLLVPIIIFFVQLKTKRKKKLKIVLNVISILISIILVIISIYCVKTNKFLDAMQSSGYKIQNYSVMVLKDSEYEQIEDIEGKNLGYIAGDDTGVSMANEEIKNKVSVELKEELNLSDLTDALTNKDVDAIMLEDAYKSILEDENTEFIENTRVIYTFSIQVPVEEISKEVSTQEPFNVFISGIDTYGKIQSVSRSDVNILVTVNPNTHQVLLTNIPRDSYVQLYNTTGTKDKLTHAGIYGIEKSVKTVEQLLDVDINYYLKVNFTSLEDIVDAIGGITVYSKYTFTSYIGNYYFKEGYNNMNGAQALGFARERKSFAEGDIMRGQNQQAVIEAIIRKVSSPSIISKYNTLLSSLAGEFETNMPTEKMTEFIKMQLDNPVSWNVTSITLNGSGSSQYTYSGGNQKLSVIILDEESVQEAQQKIDLVMQGEMLESSYGEVTNPRDTTQGASKPTTTTNTSSSNKTETNDTKQDKPTTTTDKPIVEEPDKKDEEDTEVDIYSQNDS